MDLLGLARDVFVDLLPSLRDGFAVMIFIGLAVQLFCCLAGGVVATWCLRSSRESPYSVHGMAIVALGCYMGYLFGPYVLIYLVPFLLCCLVLYIPIMLGEALWACCVG